jgi:phenylpropionate dioxygenase-like ring-hydroxylating dioxygenase large terminal subunit
MAVREAIEVLRTGAGADDPRLNEGPEPYVREDIPELGWRNYWYPVMYCGEVGKKPKAVRVLGEDVVLFRDAGKLFALRDRCAHRGQRLSTGYCAFRGTGTITCGYHGWTYDGATGECRGAIAEGPGAKVIEKVRIKPYPVEERLGIIWLFVGDMDPVPLDADIPGITKEPDKWLYNTYYSDWQCNWRFVNDNQTYDMHAPIVHQESIEHKLQTTAFGRIPSGYELADGMGMGFRAHGEGIIEADFPGLGFYTKKRWYRRRFWKAPDTGVSKAYQVYGIRDQVQLRLPGSVLVSRPHGEYFVWQVLVPVEAGVTRVWMFTIFRRHNPFWNALTQIAYWGWFRWLHDILFSGQDRRMCENQVLGGERLSRTDAGLIMWRQWSAEHARRPPEAGPARGEDADAPSPAPELLEPQATGAGPTSR